MSVIRHWSRGRGHQSRKASPRRWAERAQCPFVVFLLVIAFWPSQANAQSTFHLHKNPEGTAGTSLMLGAGPNDGSYPLQSDNFIDAAANTQRVVYRFKTHVGSPNLSGVILPGSTVTFSLWMRKTSMVGTLRPAAALYLNEASPGTLLCQVGSTVPYELTTTLAKYTFSCNVADARAITTSDRFYLEAAAWVDSGPGNHNLYVRVQVEGHAGGEHDSTVVVPSPSPPPTITGLNPASGSAGTVVTIGGTSFGATQGTSTLTFNGTAASPSAWGDTAITASVPSGATTGPVVVTTAAGASNGAGFTIVNTGSVQGVVTRATDGAPIAGALVELLDEGTGFACGDGAASQSVVASTTTDSAGAYVLSNVPVGTYDLRITASGYLPFSQGVVVVASGGTTVVSVPLQVPGAPVRYVYDALGRLTGVIAPSGESAVYNYDAVGNVTSIVRQAANAVSLINLSPAAGAVGDQVILQGTGFSPNASQNTVLFNGTSAAVATATATQLTVSVPSGASSGAVSVTTPLGSATSGASFSVTSSVPSPPTIVAFTPDRGEEGLSLTMTGTHFDLTPANNTVQFNGVSTTASASSGRQLTVSVPIGATSGRITVVTPAGQVTSEADFVVPPATYEAGEVEFAGRIEPGAPRTISFGATDKAAQLLLEGTAGQWVNLRLSQTTFAFGCDLEVRLLRPNGTLLESRGCVSGREDLSGFLLPASGTYSILLVPEPGDTGLLTVAVTTDVQGSATVDGPTVPVSITEPGRNARVAFQATGPQRVAVQITGVTFKDTYAAVVDAFGTMLSPFREYLSGSGVVFLDADIPSAGAYAVWLDPAGEDVGSASLSISTVPADVIVPATVGGGSVVLATTVPAQQAHATFAVTAGQRISVLVSPFTVPGNSQLSLRAPDGSQLTTSFFSGGNFIDANTLNQAGTYTLTVDPPGTSAGSATVTIHNIADLTPTATIDGSAVPLSVTTPGQNARVAFSASAGQRITLRVNGVTIASSSVSVQNPDGAVLVAPTVLTTTGRFLEFTTTSSGTHAVVLDPVNTNVGNVTMTLASPVASGTLTVGGPSQAVSIPTPTDVGRLAFSGTAGQRVGIQVSGVTLGSGTVSLLQPSGAILAGPLSFISTGAFLDAELLESGTHEVLVRPNGTNTGSVTLAVTVVPADVDGTIEIGGPDVVATVPSPGQRARLTFVGSSAQRVSLRIFNATISDGTDVRLLSPDGTALATTAMSTGVFVDTNVLAATGTYTIELDPRSGGTGSATLHLYEVPADAVTPIEPNGPPVGVTMGTPGQNAKLTFPGTIGQRISVTFTSVSFNSGTASLSGPTTGVSSIFLGSSSSSTAFLDARTLSENGTFTIGVNPNTSFTGGATVALYEVPPDASVSYTIGAPPTAVPLVTPGQNAAVVFDGAVGQQVTVRVTGNTYGQVNVRLTGPDNKTITSITTAAASVNLVPQFLAITGPYRVRVDPIGANTGTLNVAVTEP